MEDLHALIGIEHDLERVSGMLRDAVQRLAAPVVGALEVTCSDESELECIAAFQRHFVEMLLPDFKTAARAPFRTCNIGARYEVGSIGTAEHHFALPESEHAFKVLVVKINAHVAVADGLGGVEYGSLTRYRARSAACGALHALLSGDELPALTELRHTFGMDGVDRMATLLDAQRVPLQYRYLHAAICSARLQARRATLDIQQHEVHSPTLYWVVPCVTLNRPGLDTEIVVGVESVDCRGEEPCAEYHGLGDDPTQYRVVMRGTRLQIESVQPPAPDA